MRKSLSFIVALLFIFTLSSCAMFGDIPPEQQYLKARTAFNNLVEGYLVKYRTADLATQQEWKKDVDPQIKNAKLALDAWDLALTMGDPDGAIEEEKLFLLAKDKLLDLLIDHFVEE